MELLVKRDKTHLMPCEGRFEGSHDVPENLRNAHSIPAREVCSPASVLENQVVESPAGFRDIQRHLCAKVDGGLNGLWSGYRSALVRGGDGKLYRLKGVAWDDAFPYALSESNGTIEVFGGQPRYAARFEKKMSSEFAKALTKDGIEPVMVCKGYWHYPSFDVVRETDGENESVQLSASIIEVKGDTRLDELVCGVERRWGMMRDGKEKSRMLDMAQVLFNDIGFVLGRLKRLMDLNYQTWNYDIAQLNAHMGNVVLYKDNDMVRVGLVDFDASCNREDFSKSALKELQHKEYMELQNSLHKVVMSVRVYPAQRFEQQQMYRTDYHAIDELRNSIGVGLDRGYYYSGKDSVKNSLEYLRFSEVFKALKSSRTTAFEDKEVAVTLADIKDAQFKKTRALVLAGETDMDKILIEVEKNLYEQFGVIFVPRP